MANIQVEYGQRKFMCPECESGEVVTERKESFIFGIPRIDCVCSKCTHEWSEQTSSQMGRHAHYNLL